MADTLTTISPIRERRSRSLQVLSGLVALVVLSACSSGALTTSSAPSPLANATPIALAAATVAPSPTAAPSSLALASPAAASPSTVGASQPPSPARSAKPIPSLNAEQFAQTFSASIAIFNLADAPLTIAGSIADTTTGKYTAFGTYAVEPSGQLSEAVIPGRYRLTFHLPSLTSAPSCTLTVTDGAKYTFVAVPAAIAIDLAGAPPTSGRDLFVATASLCKG